MTDSERLKFGALREGATEDRINEADHIPHIYPRMFQRQERRLLVSLPSGHVHLIQNLLSELTPPFDILYVLVVPRGAEEGRYELREPVSRVEAEAFLRRYTDFFEQDGRHHIWLRSAQDDALIIYDRHEVLWLYGRQELFEQLLTDRGFVAGPVKIPSPHFHSYKKEFDADQNSIVESDHFVRKPLREQDSN